MTPYQRQRKRKNVRRTYDRWKGFGWVYQHVWVPSSIREAINARAKQLDMPKQIIGTAAFITGMRMMTTSDIVREQRRWREKIRPASVTKFQKGQPGGPRDPVTGQILRRCAHADSV